MITYVWRCTRCSIDWRKQFRITEKPMFVLCPECGCCCGSLIQSTGIIFKDPGFPSNDMKGLHNGVSNMPGRKPTHAELDNVEKDFPDSNTPKSYEHGDM